MQAADSNQSELYYIVSLHKRGKKQRRHRSENHTFDLNDLLIAIYVAIPTYVANSTPVLLGGGAPIDRGGKFVDGRPILGTNKTMKGFTYGFLLGSVAALAEAVLFRNYMLVLAGIVASLGALLGDLCGAFLKRRLNILPGHPLPVVDQLDFILGALLLTSPVLNITLGSFLILVIATIPIHLFSNAIAYTLRLKRRLW